MLAVARGLIIVDFQNDFTTGGALAVPDADQIAPRVNELADSREFALIVATRDWHPPDHASFVAEGGPWPPHCVAGSEGAELHPDLHRERVDAIVDAGRVRDAEGYSGFEDTALEQLLRDHDIDELVICGLATDYCVKHTTLDALKAGFRVHVDRPGIRAVEVNPGDGERAIEEMRRAGAIVG